MRNLISLKTPAASSSPLLDEKDRSLGSQFDEDRRGQHERDGDHEPDGRHRQADQSPESQLDFRFIEVFGIQKKLG